MNDYHVTHGTLFRETHTMEAVSEWALRLWLQDNRPEWFPVQIVEVLPRLDGYNEQCG